MELGYLDFNTTSVKIHLCKIFVTVKFMENGSLQYSIEIKSYLKDIRLLKIAIRGWLTMEPA